MGLVEAIAMGLGGGASAVAIFGAAAGARRRRRVTNQSRALADLVVRLARVDYWLSSAARHLDDRLRVGAGWDGEHRLPDPLTGGVAQLLGIQDELQREGARARSIAEVDAAGGRLRDDVEGLCGLLASSAKRYQEGTISTYRLHQGDALNEGASDAEATVVLEREDIEPQRRDRDRFEWLMRSCLFRTHGEATAERYRCQWPISARDLEIFDPPVVRGVVPAPIDWGESMPIPE